MKITNKLQDLIVAINDKQAHIVQIVDQDDQDDQGHGYKIEFLVFSLEAGWVYELEDVKIDRIGYSLLHKALRVIAYM